MQLFLAMFLFWNIFLFLVLRIFLDSSDVGEVLRWPVSINILAPLANGLEGETLALDDDNHCGADEREYGDVGCRLWESLFLAYGISNQIKSFPLTVLLLVLLHPEMRANKICMQRLSKFYFSLKIRPECCGCSLVTNMSSVLHSHLPLEAADLHN